MEIRNLCVVKWLATIPVVGVCTLCNREFSVSIAKLKSTETKWSLRAQFDCHICAPGTESQISRTKPRHQRIAGPGSFDSKKL